MLMYLYSNDWPAGSEIVTFHKGFVDVYSEALSEMALLVFQLPRAAMLPTILMVSPYWVSVSESKVTATVEAVAQLVAEEDVEDPVPVGDGIVTVPEMGVWDVGNDVEVADE